MEPLAWPRCCGPLATREGADLVLMGKQAIDGDNNQTGQMLAALLGWGQGTFASKLAVEGEEVRVTREVDGGLGEPDPAAAGGRDRRSPPQRTALRGPAGDHEGPRKKPLETVAPGDLGVDPAPRNRVLSVEEPPVRQAGVRGRLGGRAGGEAAVGSEGDLMPVLVLVEARRRDPEAVDPAHRRGRGGNWATKSTCWWQATALPRSRKRRPGFRRSPRCWSRTPRALGASTGPRRLAPLSRRGWRRPTATVTGAGLDLRQESCCRARRRWPTCRWSRTSRAVVSRRQPFKRPILPATRSPRSRRRIRSRCPDGPAAPRSNQAASSGGSARDRTGRGASVAGADAVRGQTPQHLRPARS